MSTTATSTTALNAAAEANVTTAILMLIKEALITAIADRRLERGHLRVLAAIATVMKGSAKAWPSRTYIAELSGLSPASVSNSLHELRAWGYLICDKETVEEASNRRLTVYTFGKVDHDTIRREITAFVQKARGTTQFTAHGDDSSPPAVKPEFTAHGEHSPPAVMDSKKSSPPAVPRIKKDNIPQNASDGADATPSRKRDATTRTKLKEDWSPAPETVAWVRANYVASDQKIADEAQKFRDYHVSKGTKMADWRAAWRTWWGNGWHKCPRRMGAHAQFAIEAAASQTATDRALHDAFERARLMDEEDAKCRR